MIPLRRSLPERTAEVISAHIEENLWGEWLPQERVLSATLGISRNSLRAALQILRGAGVVEPIRGKGYRIHARSPYTQATTRRRSVAILAPEPLNRLRPTLANLIDSLRTRLFEQNIQVEIQSGRMYYRKGGEAHLAKLIAQTPADCWVLTRASHPVQRWFSRQRIPCIAAGSTFPDLDLPGVDLDYHAVGAHAAGRLIGLGHQRLLCVAEDLPSAGLLDCLRGFQEMAERTRGVSASILRHPEDPGPLNQQLRKVFRSRQTPTAVLVANPYYYLTVADTVRSLGLAIPRDVSLLCTDTDEFLPYLIPEPARYDFNHGSFARKLLQKVTATLNGEHTARGTTRIMPKFLPGGSLGAPPAPGSPTTTGR